MSRGVTGARRRRPDQRVEYRPDDHARSRSIAPDPLTVRDAAAFGAAGFEAALRGFFPGRAVLAFARAVLVLVTFAFFRATFFVALPFVLFVAINASSFSHVPGTHSTSRAAVAVDLVRRP
jgi:hypothetical protein